MAKYNKLVTRTMRAGMFYALPPGGFDEQRCSGRSTAIALHAIASAIEQPGTHITIVDHHGTKLADECCVARAREITQGLGLMHFSFDRVGVRYNGFTDNPWEIT